MFDDILEHVERRIREEADKERPDIPQIKSLIDIWQHVKSLSIESLSDTANITVDGPRRVFAGDPLHTVPAGYGPGITERIVDEMLQMVERQVAQGRPSSLDDLAHAFSVLIGPAPQYAERIRILLESKLKEEEERHASLHSELPGGCESSPGGQ